MSKKVFITCLQLDQKIIVVREMALLIDGGERVSLVLTLNLHNIRGTGSAPGGSFVEGSLRYGGVIHAGYLGGALGRIGVIYGDQWS